MLAWITYPWTVVKIVHYLICQSQIVFAKAKTDIVDKWKSHEAFNWRKLMMISTFCVRNHFICRSKKVIINILTIDINLSPFYSFGVFIFLGISKILFPLSIWGLSGKRGDCKLDILLVCLCQGCPGAGLICPPDVYTLSSLQKRKMKRKS